MKIDLEEAYDKLEWSFIRRALVEFGLNEKPVALIMECISSTKMSLVINGSHSPEFSPSRGIR